MAVQLDQPNDDEEIYHARDEEVSLARPLLTGDVVDDVDVPGIGRSPAMIVAHPCNMRRGAELAPKLTCAPVAEYQRVEPNQWADGFARVFPLSSFRENDHRAARLDELVSVPTERFDLGARMICLEHRGIFLLQQRIIHSIARCKVSLSTIRESMEHVLVEAGLLEDWVEDLSDPADAASRESAIASFEEFIAGDLRAQLQDPNRRSQVIARVSREMASRS